jgi:hypothetical protein
VLEQELGLAVADQLPGQGRVVEDLGELGRGHVPRVREHVADHAVAPGRQVIRARVALRRGAQVEDRVQAERGDQRHVVARQAVERGRAVEHAVPDPPAVGRSPAAEVAQVGERGDHDVGAGLGLGRHGTTVAGRPPLRLTRLG